MALGISRLLGAAKLQSAPGADNSVLCCIRHGLTTIRPETASITNLIGQIH